MEVLRVGLLSMVVCVPKESTDEEITEFCNSEVPCGTANGWCSVVRDTKEYPQSNPVVCSNDENSMHFVVMC